MGGRVAVASIDAHMSSLISYVSLFTVLTDSEARTIYSSVQRQCMQVKDTSRYCISLSFSLGEQKLQVKQAECERAKIERRKKKVQVDQ